ncbi:unnamed protein product [Brassica oleracea]
MLSIVTKCCRVLLLSVLSRAPSNMVKTSRSGLSSFRKKDVDPFLEAYRKCLENSLIRISSSMGRKVRADDQNCYATGNKNKSLLLWLWSKYSCKFRTDGWSTVSRFRKSKKRIDSTNIF